MGMIVRKFSAFIGIPFRNFSGFMGGTVEDLNGTTPYLGKSSNPPGGTYKYPVYTVAVQRWNRDKSVTDQPSVYLASLHEDPPFTLISLNLCCCCHTYFPTALRTANKFLARHRFVAPPFRIEYVR